MENRLKEITMKELTAYIEGQMEGSNSNLLSCSILIPEEYTPLLRLKITYFSKEGHPDEHSDKITPFPSFTLEGM